MSKTIWLVQIQRHGSCWQPTEPTCRVVCACDSEEAAHKAGQQITWMYNNPRFNPDANLAGVVTQDILIPELEYRYAVKKHEGEWY